MTAIPDAAVAAGALRIWGTTLKNATEIARAVLEAATQEIPCPNALAVDQGECDACGGSGVLFVLKRSVEESHAGSE